MDIEDNSALKRKTSLDGNVVLTGALVGAFWVRLFLEAGLALSPEPSSEIKFDISDETKDGRLDKQDVLNVYCEADKQIRQFFEDATEGKPLPKFPRIDGCQYKTQLGITAPAPESP